MQYFATDSSKHSVVISAQDEDNGTGMRPPDMLLAAIGGCTAIGVTLILQRKRQDLKGLEINVSGQQDKEPPRAFNSITIEYVVSGHEISRKAVEDAIKLSLGKYCSVSATV
jgi:putative redox protein